THMVAALLPLAAELCMAEIITRVHRTNHASRRVHEANGAVCLVDGSEWLRYRLPTGLRIRRTMLSVRTAHANTSSCMRFLPPRRVREHPLDLASRRRGRARPDPGRPHRNILAARSTDQHNRGLQPPEPQPMRTTRAILIDGGSGDETRFTIYDITKAPAVPVGLAKLDMDTSRGNAEYLRSEEHTSELQSRFE